MTSMETVSAVVVPSDESKPLAAILVGTNAAEDLETTLQQLQEADMSSIEMRRRLLLRSGANGTAGLYAHHVVDGGDNQHKLESNVRATRLAMACGLFSFKFFGNVILVRASLALRKDLRIDEVQGACCISPDLRYSLQKEMCQNPDDYPPVTPRWLGDALQQNYHDMAVLAKLADVMSNESSSDSEAGQVHNATDINPPTLAIIDHSMSANPDKAIPREYVTKHALCLHCRRKAISLCPGCKGCYFCDSPRNCRAMGWTHACLCPTWKVYADRRHELSRFHWLGGWTHLLTAPAFQFSEQPYEDFLVKNLTCGSDQSDDDCNSTWWSTEAHGWAGGMSLSARMVDISVRKSYAQGFAPLTEIPPQRQVDEDDVKRANKVVSVTIRHNSVGLLYLTSWEQYYQLRMIPASSPVALLCTFPLSLYYAITHYGEVPCTVARMLNRPLRVHLVGVEKEANFLDLFREVGYLLPSDFSVDLTFIVREDMLPPKCRHGDGEGPKSIIHQLHLCPNLSITVVSGTYGDSANPNFDCGGGGSPDLVVGLNAGMYAYDSWKHVVRYLFHNPGVVGVFTDYNEHSGAYCSSLGGHKSRESLCINPFRQPRAMPVYSMNLPQFSNGFLYVMSPQELE